MKIEPIRMEFQVTQVVRRFVYMYLLLGRRCYLIDGGAIGAAEAVEQCLRQNGRSADELDRVFLTHAHPDHMGGAAELKKKCGCRICASTGERPWIEDTELQFRQRPIPNFHGLVGGPVHIDEILKDGDVVTLEPGMTLRVVGTPGHSCDGLSFWLEEERCIFTGDAIPVPEDIPIWVSGLKSKSSLEKLKSLCRLEEIEAVYPAWDRMYFGVDEILNKIRAAQELVDWLQAVAAEGTEETEDERMLRWRQHPLFQRTMEAMKEEKPDGHY